MLILRVRMVRLRMMKTDILLIEVRALENDIFEDGMSKTNKKL